MRALTSCLFFCCHFFFASAQCPPNLDFEQGNFTGWQCWVGHSYINSISGKNEILWDVPPANTPVDPALYPDRFVMLSSFPGNGFDQFGLFAKNCPNGSGHSIQLGNNIVNSPETKAEGISYTFTIPAGQDEFNLIYHYAVVLHLPPNDHNNEQMPRFVITVENLTDGTILPCPLDPFIPGINLPGFVNSPLNPDVKCKKWAAASIKLNGLAGKTIRLFFKTASCTPSAHFGYAYIDINTQCSSSFIGAAYCPGDAFINVTAPFGYQSYEWWDVGFTTLLASTQTINFTPPPTPNTTIAVIVNPYNGYGCKDTLYAHLVDTLTIQSQAGPDKLECTNLPVQLGAIPTPGYVYSWSPVTGLSNPNISNPIANPAVTTEYILTTSSAGGGCVSTDTVIVARGFIDNTLTLIGPSVSCAGTSQTVMLQVLPTDSIQWYHNAVAIPGANQTQYTVLQTGSYYATLFTISGCVLNTATQVITINEKPIAGFTVNTNAQCFKDHQFVFTNNSLVSSGALQYEWNMGDGTLLTTEDVTYSYTVPGNYTVKLLVTTDKGCKDSTSFNITVYPSPIAGFTINSANQCHNSNQFIFTNTSTVYSGALQYHWDLGDGTTAFTRDVTHSYSLPGVYTVKMLATAADCADSSSFTVHVYPHPVADFFVPPAICVDMNVPLINKTINNTTTVINYLWDFGNGHTSTVRNPSYSYPTPGNYTIRLTVDMTQCPQLTSMRELNVFIDAPVPGISYPELDARYNFPEQLQARSIGTSVLWTPATSLDNRTSYSPVFKGINPQVYTIELKTNLGCITVDTQIVKTLKRINIYVPTVFTPNDNGTNDQLRPLLFGFAKVNYFRIYNRWGKLLFQMQSDRPGWDGKLNGNPQETQTLVWMIEAIDVDGKVHKQRGTTVLVR